MSVKQPTVAQQLHGIQILNAHKATEISSPARTHTKNTSLWSSKTGNHEKTVAETTLRAPESNSIGVTDKTTENKSKNQTVI